jgi:hypothetical protein
MDFNKLERIGNGCEGTVYKISDNVVMKAWNSRDTKYTLEKRLWPVLIKINSLHPVFRKYVTIPEFLGYEIRAGQLFTYHEYIKGTKVPDNFKPILRKLISLINKYFSDSSIYALHEGYDSINSRYLDNKIYLLDVYAN